MTSRGHWAERYIKDLIRKGILNGRDDKKFHPEDRVTRAEFATMTSKFFNLDNQSATQDFNDVPPDHWAFNYVEATKDYFDAYQNLNGRIDFHPGQGAEAAGCDGHSGEDLNEAQPEPDIDGCGGSRSDAA